MTIAQQMLEDSRLQAEAKSTTQTIKASNLVALFRQARDERWGYIWGESGGIWTQKEQDSATRDMTIQHGQKWVGKRVADCSGLFRWAANELGGYVYHGSNTMWNAYTDPDMRGAVGGLMEIFPGTAVYQNTNGKRTHVGLYVGVGKYGVETVIEAQGTRTGVVESKLSAWDEWGELLVKIGGEMYVLDYDIPANVIDIPPRTMRKGDSGEDVMELQEALVREGYDVGKKKDGTPLIDGKYGGETLSAVRAFQSDRGLKPDGIAGPLTLNALRQTEDDEPDDDEDEDKPVEAPDAPQEPTTDPEQDAWMTLTLEEKVENLHERLKRQEGGESDG